MSGPALHVRTGGGEHRDGQPWVVFLHGASMNGTAWATQARHFAARGWNVAAFDLPGHGDSPDPPLDSVPDLAAAVAADLAARGVETAAVAGHSLGGLIGLELAATPGALVGRLAVVGAGLALAVNQALLDAAASDPELAVEAMVDWAYSRPSHLGGAQVPGLWLDGAGRALMRAEVTRHPGAIRADFAACAAYDGGPAAAERIGCPVLVLSGSADLMTPPRLGKAAAAAVAGGRYVELDGCGHMLMAERPREVTAQLWRFFTS